MGGREAYVELYRQARTGQTKYDYFLMGVAAAAVALSLKRTEAMPLDWSLIPLGLAVASWGASFFAGCKRQRHVDKALHENLAALDATDAEERQVRRRRVESIGDATVAWSSRQFRLLVLGAVLYVCWHLWVMKGNAGAS